LPAWLYTTTQCCSIASTAIHSGPCQGAEPSQPIQITSDGGGLLENGWRRDGKEILFGSADGQIMAVAVDPRSESLSVGRPVALFRPPIDRSAVAVAPNADRFLVSERPYTAAQTIHVLTHWRERLNQHR
jgi:hypothetical protein